MHPEFEKLYNDWFRETCLMSHSHYEVDSWKALVEWSQAHKSEAVDGIIEILQQEPNWIVELCDVLFPDTLKSEGFVPLDMWCNTWLVILIAAKNGQALETTDPRKFPDNYKDYKKFQKYMETHYIPWNPFHEDDPNITLEEFKAGKRNDPKLIRNKRKELEKS